MWLRMETTLKPLLCRPLLDKDCFSLLKASSIIGECDSISRGSSCLAFCQILCTHSCQQNHTSTDARTLHACTHRPPQDLAVMLALGHGRAGLPAAERAPSPAAWEEQQSAEARAEKQE